MRGTYLEGLQLLKLIGQRRPVFHLVREPGRESGSLNVGSSTCVSDLVGARVWRSTCWKVPQKSLHPAFTFINRETEAREGKGLGQVSVEGRGQSYCLASVLQL